MTNKRMPPGFYFIRHGQTTDNRARICSGGESDPHLTELGSAQAHDAGRLLKSLRMPTQHILTSPLSRTRETAAIVCDLVGLDVNTLQIEPQLIERKLGEWNGQPAEKIQPMLSADMTPPGGESADTFRARVVTIFSQLAPLYADIPLIVGSRGIARILLESASQRINCNDTANLPNGAVLRITLAPTNNFEIVECMRLDPLAPTS